MSQRPKTKAAKDIKEGDWCAFGTMAFRASEPHESDGKIYICMGYTVSEFDPDERVTMHYDD